jgi:hypothetical protein
MHELAGLAEIWMGMRRGGASVRGEPLAGRPFGLRLRIRRGRDPESAVLGRQRLLWRWRNGVQWNPADDLCVAAEVVIDPGIESEAWSHSGEIFEALARART